MYFLDKCKKYAVKFMHKRIAFTKEGRVMKRIFCIIMILAMAFTLNAGLVFADDIEDPGDGTTDGNVEVYLTEDIFPDEAFRDWLRTKFDGNNNQALDESEMYKMTLLEIPSDLGIKSVKGIEQIPNLVRLTISYQVSGMEDMQADLYIKSSYVGYLDIKGCSKIRQLKVDADPTSKVYITGRDLTGCTGLEELILPNCYDLKELKGLKTCTALKNIDIKKFGKLEEFDISGFPELWRLVINSNPLKSINVTNCPKLEIAYIGGESPDGEETIDHIDFSGCTSLTSIYLSSPALKTIDISDCTKLDNITINKDIRYKNYAPVESLDLSNQPELRGVFLMYAGLKSLDLSKNPLIESVHLEQNGMTSLNLGNAQYLYLLEIIKEDLETLDISGCPKLCYAVKNSENSGFGDITSYAVYDEETGNIINLNYDAYTKLIYDEGAIEPRTTDISGAAMTLSKTTYTYDGTVKKPSVKSVVLNGVTLKAGTDYTVSYASGRKNAGFYKVTVTGIKKYSGKISMAFEINKAKNNLKVTAKTATVKYSKLKTANQTVARKSVLTVTGGKGTITYTKMNGPSKITINKTTGKVTVKKGLKKGTYKVKVNIKAAGTKNYKPLTLTRTFKIKVK